jgi:hypothetical protein
MRLLLVVVLLAVAASPGHAAPRRKLAILEIVPSTSTKGFHAALGSASTALTTALRSQVFGDPVFAYQPFPKAVDQGSLARTCAIQAPVCAAQVISDVGADVMIYGVVDKLGDRIQIVLKIQEGKKVLRASFRVVPLTAGPDVFRLAAREMYLELTGRPVPQTR